MFYIIIFIFDDLYIYLSRGEKLTENNDSDIIKNTMKRLLQIQVAFCLIHWYSVSIIIFLVFLGLFFAKYPEIFFRFDPIVRDNIFKIGKIIDSGLQKLSKTSSKVIIQTEKQQCEEVEEKTIDRPVSCSSVPVEVPNSTGNNQRGSTANSFGNVGVSKSDVKPSSSMN